MIINIEPSRRKNKRYKITMDNDKTYDFGYDGASTYIDHHDKLKRENYFKRHYANKTEKYLIDNLIPSPALFSYYILWGPHTDINKNIKYLNDLWKEKHKKRSKL